ncbi:MAG TPA: efflux RND transporter periplasmic adaptor subunit [Vicinamibacterales bacterium]|jgi:HlyD family secretion protein|nr:efflux RND transporter periplasmic adaptor subunit [Vicinamibacterales bacterium]
MKKAVIGLVLLAVVGAGVYVYRSRSSNDGSNQNAATGGAAAGGGAPGGGAAGGANGQQGRGGGRRGGGAGGFGGGQFGRPPLTVELAKVSRATIQSEITVVGNLIGQLTVSVAPRAAGRVESVTVKLGDRVSRGQRLAKIEDFDIQEQVKQAEAAQQVSEATIRQREADLKLAQTNAERSRSLFERQLLPKQTLDDNEARYQSSIAAVDLAKAQSSQSKARLDELRINLGNTIISSPVNGFVSKRTVDPGAFVSQNVPVVEVVDISTVRLVANVVEKDLKELQSGNTTRVEVDAFPGEVFTGRIARVSPVLDPATRTAPIEIEIPNAAARLKPGMYARVSVTTSTKKQALVVPATAVVDLGGRRGVFTPLNESAVFRALDLGTEQKDLVEVLGGLNDGDTVITTGSSALRDGDRIVLPGGARGRRGGGAGNGTAGAGTGGFRGRGESGGRATGGEATGAAREGSAGRRSGGQGAGAREGGSREGGARPNGSGREGGARDGRSRRGAPPAALAS